MKKVNVEFILALIANLCAWALAGLLIWGMWP